MILILTPTLESSNLSLNLSICSIFSGESMAEPEVQPESLMEKIYGHHRSSSSSSSDDDKPAKLHDAVKPKVVDNKPSAHDSVKSNIFRIFGREKPVHKVLGGGKRTLSPTLLFLSLCFVCTLLNGFEVSLFRWSDKIGDDQKARICKFCFRDLSNENTNRNIKEKFFFY